MNAPTPDCLTSRTIGLFRFMGEWFRNWHLTVPSTVPLLLFWCGRLADYQVDVLAQHMQVSMRIQMADWHDQ